MMPHAGPAKPESAATPPLHVGVEAECAAVGSSQSNMEESERIHPCHVVQLAFR